MPPMLGPEFQQASQSEFSLPRNQAALAALREILEKQKTALVLLAPRGIGPTRWAVPGSAEDAHIRRRFVLLGRTLDGQRVWDVVRAVRAVREIPELKNIPLWLGGEGDMAGVALYAAIMDPVRVSGLDLVQLPASHRQGPILLNVRRYLDLPQALVLAFPRPIRLTATTNEEAQAWEWARQFQARLGKEYLKIDRAGR
jgi:hypothetical protein